jgi:putative transposase
LRARLVREIAEWRWSSFWFREHGGADHRALLSAWPVTRPRHWAECVREPQSEAELAALRTSLRRGAPYGGPKWTLATAKRLGLAGTLRPRGRPRKPR